jgi:glycosyltransferase involved in cell wall biosynthesis
MRHPVTILMPIYQAQKELYSTLPRLLTQIAAYDELLVIDDGSTDLDSEFLISLRNKFSNLSIHSREHFGLVDSLNFGLSIAKNEFVARADADDFYDSDRLAQQVDLLSNNSELVAVFSDYSINRNGLCLGAIVAPQDPELIKLSLVRNRRTAHPSVMFRKSAVISVGGYLADDFPCEDLSLWMRLTSRGKLGSVPSVMLHYTLSRLGITETRKMEMLRRRQSLIDSYFQSANLKIYWTAIKNYDFRNNRREREGELDELFTLIEFVILIRTVKCNIWQKVYFVGYALIRIIRPSLIRPALNLARLLLLKKRFTSSPSF